MYSFDNNSALDKYATIQEDVLDMYDVEPEPRNNDEILGIDYYESDIEDEQLDWEEEQLDWYDLADEVFLS